MIKKFLILGTLLTLTACGHTATLQEAKKNCDTAENYALQYTTCMETNVKAFSGLSDKLSASQAITVAQAQCASKSQQYESFYSSCLSNKSELPGQGPKIGIWDAINLSRTERDRIQKQVLLNIMSNKISETSIPQNTNQMHPIVNDIGSNARVIMPIFYQELAPYKNFMGTQRGLQSQKYFTSATFKNTVTGAILNTGQENGMAKYANYYDYTTAIIEPGHYNLISFSIGDKQTPYDGVSCGNIGFDIKEKDLILLKGIKPIAITDEKNVLGMKRRKAVYIEFSATPPDYVSYVKNIYGANYPYIIVAPMNDNPVAFNSCVQGVNPKYESLMDEEGSFSLSSDK